MVRVIERSGGNKKRIGKTNKKLIDGERKRTQNDLFFSFFIVFNDEWVEHFGSF